jgi:hypothetical protein
MDTKPHPSFTGKSKKSLDSKVRLRRIDNLIFIICIVIAAAFWTLIKLSEFYTESFSLKVSYINIPEGKKLTALDDSTVSININARGYTLFRMLMFEDMQNININLDNFNIDRREGDHYFIFTQEMKERLGELFNLSESDFEFSNTTLGFVLEDLAEKNIRVEENLNLRFRQEFDLYEPPIMTPEEVLVYGPADMLDTIVYLETEPVELSLIDEDLTTEVKIANPYPDLLEISPEFVTVSLRVEKYTERSIEIPIDFSSLNVQVKSFPSNVKVNFQVALKDFTLVQPGQFQVVPEIEGVDIQNTDRLHLKLLRRPEIVRNPWIVPADVEYLIIK